MDGSRLTAVVHVGARAVGVDVVHLLRGNAGVGQRLLHAADGPHAAGSRGGKVVGVTVGTVTHYFRVNFGTARLGVFKAFQHEDAAALAHDEAAAAGVKGQAGCLRVLGRGEGFHAGKTADAQRADAALGTAADHDGLIAIPDAMEGIAHGVGAARAGRDRAGAHSLEAKANGDLGRCHVGNGHRDKIRADLFHSLFQTTAVLLLDGGQAADAAGHADTDVFALCGQIQAAVGQCLRGSAQRQQGEPGHLAGLFFIHNRLGVKVFDLSGQLALEFAGVKLGDGPNAALACLGSGPALGGGVAQRVHGAKARNHDSAFFHKRISPFTLPCRRLHRAPAR